MSYDSTVDTTKHIQEVQRRLFNVVDNLMERAQRHDASKLEEPEKSAFDAITPKLAGTTYGSEEYKRYLREQRPAIQHHYSVNDHHPEHFNGGFWDMNLLQMVEMLADWKAASMRHDDGDLRKSIIQNAERFGYDEKMTAVLMSTARELGWL